MNAMVPALVPVLEARQELADVVTLTIGTPRGGAPARAGQFNMLYAFGVGEVALSMSGPPARSDVAIHTIRAVGTVTEALCRLKAGGTVGVRGPFGTPWPMDQVAGSDLLIVAGGVGLAPLRPVVYEALARRSAYGRVVLLVGARTPEDLLFRDELDAWQRAGDLTVLVTVDRAATFWKGRVGVAPALLPELELTPATTTAFVCGPEIMMRFTVRALVRRGVPEARIFLSMERNMKCAIGHCGHCQLGPTFICKDGPVLGYDRLRTLLWQREA